MGHNQEDMPKKSVRQYKLRHLEFLSRVYKYQKQQYMEPEYHSIQLGLLSEAETNLIMSLNPTCDCVLTRIFHSESAGTITQKVLLELRGDYVLQFNPIEKNIISGFKCDYSINFEIIRSPAQTPNSLGAIQGIDFVFPSQGNKRVSLIAEDTKKLQFFGKKLEKKYIVQTGFREGFKAVKILGKGVTATVYKACRFRDQCDVAIKSFKRSSYFAIQNGKLSFQKQFRILTLLHHRNVCSLEGVYQTQNSTYIVMENLALSLFGWIQKHGFPPFEEGRRMVLQLLKGIQHLHSKGIMHRDLKLQNVMVRRDCKQNPEIVIVDLGLAEFTDSQKFLYTRCGTPGYVAPEILKCKPAQNERYNQTCDIFSIGVIFHILFFKKSLFEGSQVKDVIKKNTQCNINFAADHFSGLCSEGIDLMKKMLEKDPSKRISATEALNHEFLKPAFQQEQQSIKIDSTFQSINNITA